MRSEVLVSDLNAGRWQVLVDDLVEQVDVPLGVHGNSIDEALVLGGVEEFSQVRKLNLDDLSLLVDDLLELSHVLQLAMDGVLLLFLDAWILVAGDEVNTLA